MKMFLTLSYGVYLSQLFHFARVCSIVSGFNKRKQFSNVLKQVYAIMKFAKHFLNSDIDTKS